MKSTQSFWERRQILYYNVPIAITQALRREEPNGSFSPELLSANLEKSLGQDHLEGFSLHQCLHSCNSKERDLCGTTNGVKMPDVKAVKIFEDIKVLNEVLEKPCFPTPLTYKTAPTKFEVVQQSLKSGMVIVKMNSKEFIITACSNKELISAENSGISREEFNKNATEACFADDLRTIIFQDFSVKDDSTPSKASLVREVLNQKRKPVLAGIRIQGFLYCVLIVRDENETLIAKKWRLTGEEDGYVAINCDCFDEIAIEAYFFDTKSPSPKINDLHTQAQEPTQKPEEIKPPLPERTQIETPREVESPCVTQETSEQKYYDSVIFKKSEGLEYSFTSATKMDYPELILNSNYRLDEVELTDSLEKNVTTNVEGQQKSPFKLTGSLSLKSGTTRRILYRRNDDNNKPILVSSVQNANQSNPSTNKLWGLMVRNQASEVHLIPKLTALSLRLMVGDAINEHPFQPRDFWFLIGEHSKKKIFHHNCSNQRALESLLCQSRDIGEHEYKIRDKQLILFEEWPGKEKCEGFLFCLKFIAAESKKLFCGLIRAKSKEVEEKLILEFGKLV